MYVYRVYNKKTGAFRVNLSTGHSMWLRRSDAEKRLPLVREGQEQQYVIKKYELVEVPNE